MNGIMILSHLLLNYFAICELLCDPVAKVFSKAVYLCIDKGIDLRKHATKFVVYSKVRTLGTLQAYKQP